MYPWLEDALAQLASRAVQQTLHHGLLICGGPQTGKRALAQALSGVLLCQRPDGNGPCGACQGCQLFSAQSHPDAHTIESEKQIGVDAIRDAINKLSGTAQLSGNKVLTIVDADTMTESAANALLKTLEEPTSKTYLLLLCSAPQRLPATILSRCERFTVTLPSSEQALAFLAQQGVSCDAATLRFFNDSPLAVLAADRDKQRFPADLFNDLRQLQARQLSAMAVAESWQEDAERMVHWIQRMVVDGLNTSASDETLLTFYRQCTQAIERIRQSGTNKGLLLQGLLIALAEGPLHALLKEDNLAG
ncbi:AAA family ATPase [Aestuariibacter halophilus]|uniref:DNA-directed DNA polymerase n=1 Tax=Fluctibacter halophilus TaxID=226011 RepID=A0ABS8G582_9ALTE|nr:AAA family ATPase [Aestuariibacter halophilus]MCC2615638.1 AAA family ATPase [Aestuariibacter halophilus]